MRRRRDSIDGKNVKREKIDEKTANTTKKNRLEIMCDLLSTKTCRKWEMEWKNIQ